MAKYTFLNLAEEVLLGHSISMSAQEIWEQAVAKGFDSKLGSQGQTPWSTLSARLLVDFRDNPMTAFVRDGVKPARYFLKDKVKSLASITLVNKELDTINDDVEPEATTSIDVLAPVKSAKYPYKERELHPFVARFAHINFRGAFCKTIFHETSSKKSFTEWLHPDIVGFWFPFENYNKELLALSGSGLSIARFYSFELKRELNFSNLRESFFQAVSNSSWAHEGYLVAANIDESDEQLREELSRLSGSFGIGVIQLDLANPQASQVIFTATAKDSIDWDGANKLAKENPDFRKFLSNARIDITNAHAHPAEFDPVLSLEQLGELWSGWNAPNKH